MKLTNPPSLPVPRLMLAQVGQWKVPRLSFKTTIKPEVKQATTDIYRGPTYDFDAGRRADLQPLVVSHTGAYECCGTPKSCAWAISEWDGIVRSMGVLTPILFYRFPYCVDCPEGCDCHSLYGGGPCYRCIRKKPCGDWMWAMGTVTTITNDLSADDFKSPQTASATLEIRLAGPLQLATWRKWWYGPDLIAQGPCLTLEDAATALNAVKNRYAPPCGPGDCCSRFRFWPRDIAIDVCALDCLAECNTLDNTMFWDDRYVWRIYNTCFNLYVPGHTTPKVKAVLDGADTVTVRNALGTQTIAYATTGTVYSDNSTGLVWLDAGAGYNLMPTALSVLTLEPGENVITTDGRILTLGITPYWVN